MTHKKNILLFQRLIPHYRVALFKKLHEKLGIVVCHSRARKGASLQEQQELGFPNEVLPRVYFGKAPTSMVQFTGRVLRKHKPSIVITEFSLKYLTFWWLFFLRFFYGYKLVVWTHGVKSKEKLKPFTTFRSKIQLWVYRKADAVILYAEPEKEMLAQYVDKPEKLFVANNTLDTEKLNEIYNRLAASGRDHVKEKLGYSNKYNLVFIGRLLWRKRMDMLFESFEKISKKLDVGLHIIGSGPEEEMVRSFAGKHQNVHYHGPINNLELSSKHLFASDLMVMPGYVGLSAVHSMAMGCPVATCRQGDEGPYHGPEVAYIKNGENGVLSDYSAEAFTEALLKLLPDATLLHKMSAEARKTITAEAGIDRFVSGFEEAVGYVGGLK